MLNLDSIGLDTVETPVDNAKRNTRTMLAPIGEQLMLAVQVAVVAGCGGTGWHVAKQLALSNMCRELVLVDYDTIKVLNLNRLDAPTSLVGEHKSIALASEIRRIHPGIVVSTAEERMQADEISSYTKAGEGYGVRWVFDCTDNALFQSQLSTACRKLKSQASVIYTRVSYNGLSHITIAKKTSARILDSAETGYEITPSWSLPAQLAATLGIYYALVQTAQLGGSRLRIGEVVPIIRVSSHYHRLFDYTILPKRGK